MLADLLHTRRFDVALAGLGGSLITLLFNALCGQDMNWDLANYHFVSAHLFWNADYGRHIALSQLQTWINPVIYVPYYLAIGHLPPIVASCIFAIAAGMNAPVIFLLAEKIGWRLEFWPRRLVAFGSVAVGMTGAIFLGEAGTTFVDNVLSIPVLAALLICIDALDPIAKQNCRSFLAAGLLLGLASGLKLTFVIFAITAAIGLAVLIAIRRLGIVPFLCFALAGALGYLLTGGWWAFWLWHEYGNPIFPLLNNVFHSPFAPEIPLNDTRFMAKRWFDFVAFPYHWMIGDLTPSPGAEITIRDPRYAILSISSIAFIGSALLRRRFSSEKLDAPASGDILLVIFFLASYSIWLVTFGILRYAVVLELLSGVLMIVAASELLASRPTFLPATALVLAAITLVATRPSHWDRVRFTADWFGVSGTEAISSAQTVYVLPGGEPVGYLLPFFPSDSVFVRVGGNMPFTPASGLGKRVDSVLHRQNVSLRSLGEFPMTEQEKVALRGFGLEVIDNSCRQIQTKFKLFQVGSCKVQFGNS
jgi:hypothetical protein